ncbi:MAG TPA: glycosyltransferase, partial [Pseudonocardiaceae bacterium]|nr:glycosyltransferase [Pseudonocardiaceae bacterium]
MSYTVVIPTIGRASLGELLTQLAQLRQPILVIDDRPAAGAQLRLPRTGVSVRVLRSGGRGPAAARNVGWRATETEWVAFLDDDVLPGPAWAAQLVHDLRGLGPDVGASQGRIEVPLPRHRRPTDAERGTAGLATARWITADMAYRRAALQRVGGFDERFGRAYREDADLALRVIAAGYRIVQGQRCTVHPVRPSAPLASVRAQRGNSDDVLMRRRHGPGWRERIGDGPGRLRRHALTTAAAAVAVGAAVRRRHQVAATAGLAWAALTTEFAAHRILPGPRGASEIGRMLASSIAIPPVACWHRLAGELRWRAVSPAIS